jgi:DNA repair protein RadD
MGKLRALFAAGCTRALLVAPTGFGKTVMIATITKGHLERVPEGRILIIVHRRELVRQTVAKLRRGGMEVGVIQGDEHCVDAPVIVASLATLLSRGTRPEATLVLWDEAHHCPAVSFRKVFASYPDALHIGVTATPQRSDGKPLGDMFEALIEAATIRQLTEAGWLVPSEILAPADTRSELSMHPVAAYQKHTPGRSAVVFGSSVAHARLLADEFNAAGIRAACVDGETDDEIRDDVLARFESGELDVITNCFVLTEGWDCPRAEVCILARASENVGTYLQMVGRVLRPAPGKRVATVIDLRGVVHLHGLPDEDRAWSLVGPACRRTEAITALRRCTECLAVFRPAVACPRCGARHETVEKIPRVLKRAERLERLNDVPQHVRDRRYFLRLVGLAESRMRMPNHRAREWAARTFERRFGRKPEIAA